MGRPIAPAKHGYMILIYGTICIHDIIYMHMSVTMLRTQPASTLYQLLAINFGIDGSNHESVSRWEMPKSSQINMTLLTEDGDMDGHG